MRRHHKEPGATVRATVVSGQQRIRPDHAAFRVSRELLEGTVAGSFECRGRADVIMRSRRLRVATGGARPGAAYTDQAELESEPRSCAALLTWISSETQMH